MQNFPRKAARHLWKFLNISGCIYTNLKKFQKPYTYQSEVCVLRVDIRFRLVPRIFSRGARGRVKGVFFGESTFGYIASI